MPERELWPAGPGSEPVTHIGSCDSMTSTTSTHSGSSDSSYDFLSAEEKECLLFLEKTIGSLEAEADSGPSTNESEPGTTPQGFLALSITQQAPQEKPEEINIQEAPEPKRVIQASNPPESHSLGLRCGSYSLPRNLHLGRSQNLGKSATQTNSHFSEAPEVLLAEPKKGQASQRSKRIQAPARSQEATFDLNAVLIPPPEAFQDTRPKQGGEDSSPKEPGEQSHTPQLHTLVISQKREEMSSEMTSHKTTEKGWTEGPQQAQLPPAQSSQNIRAEEAPLLSGVKLNIQQAPLTTPKPRKLPPNIVLKSSRSSFHNHPQNWLSCHTEAIDSVSSSLQEQKKARREALEKLGLPQDQDDPNVLVGKHTSALRFKEAAGQGPSQAPAPVQPTTPALVSAAVPNAVAPMASPGKVWIPAQEPPPGKVSAARSTPIPIPKAPKVKSSLEQPKSDPGLTLQESSIPGLKQINFKSNTLERSGVGLSSYLLASEKDPSCQASPSLGSLLDKASPSVLRNSRPRPASLGTRKDFAGIQGGMLADLDQCSLPLSYQGQSRDKLPRPPCVSVKISPKGVPDEHRREALKKLGLLKE
uniref:Expressed sequence AA986860 n=1 Tax=Nannospalax galili TaxID=1026970 RepID=A0A8C6QAX5_NANGA